MVIYGGFMSDTVVTPNLEIGAAIREGIAIGTKNIGPILVNVLLWVLTIWIPYLNVGTTIALSAGIAAKASRGEVIPMTEIFDPKYRKRMGEYFLVCGFIMIGVGAGMALFIIPGIVISLAWSLAILLVIDKGKNPIEAITISNNCTYGNKLKMAVIYFGTALVFTIVQIILSVIGVAADAAGFLGFIVFLTIIFEIFVFVGLQASVYKQLTAGI